MIAILFYYHYHDCIIEFNRLPRGHVYACAILKHAIATVVTEVLTADSE